MKPDGAPMSDEPQRRLAEFIRQDMHAIVAEWVAFARNHVPSGKTMTHLALRDHIEEILTFFAEDLESAQSYEEQVLKSKGQGPESAAARRSAAKLHGALRLKDGFDIDEMVSEYRALRASVVKLWTAEPRRPLATDLYDLTRFNEAVDQALAESVAEYTKLVNDSRNLFLGMLGHDLRSPIGAASMAAERLKQLLPPDSNTSSLASHIVDATQRGLQILNDLLDITRSATGNDIPVVKAPMNMGQLATEIVQDMRSLAKTRDIHLQVVGDTDGVWDRSRIGQVLSNLIGNAIEYSTPDTAVTVTVTGSPADVAVSVHNFGRAIPADRIEGLFEALTRGQAALAEHQSAAHLGLGLYISKKIVVAHGGAIEVASDESGTTFTARFPRA